MLRKPDFEDFVDSPGCAGMNLVKRGSNAISLLWRWSGDLIHGDITVSQPSACPRPHVRSSGIEPAFDTLKYEH
jgi:hypothetical protein